MKIILCERVLEWTIKEPPFGVRGININKIKSSIQTKDKLKKKNQFMDYKRNQILNKCF